MKDYTEFTPDDFIADEYFLQWVFNPDAESNAFWNQFLHMHPEKEEVVNQAVNFVSSLNIKEDLPFPGHVEMMLRKNLANIREIEQSEINRKYEGGRRRSRWILVSVAMAACLLLFMGWQFWPKKPLMIQVVTGAGEIKKITLPDQSVVTLNAHSSIRYPASLKDLKNRELWLEGEAFFQIKHIEKNNGPARHFVVHSGKLNVEVLGTSFNVHEHGSVTKVTLNTGKIRIGVVEAPHTYYYMQPGDFIQYSPGEKLVLKKQVKPELYSVWMDKKISVKDMPLADIIQLIEDNYGYTVEVKDKDLASLKISGTLIMDEESSLLQTLAAVMDIDIVKNGHNLLFQLKPKYKTN